MNSNRSPWRLLVPEGVTTSTDEELPRAAASPLVSTLNSCTASGKARGKVVPDVVAGAIQDPVRRAAAQRQRSHASNREVGPAAEDALVARSGLDRASVESYEIRHLPTVERQLDDPLGLDYSAHPRIPGFNQGGAGFHVDPLVDLPDFQRDFDQRVALDLELDPGLHVSREAFLTDFQPVWPERQVRQDPAA